MALYASHDSANAAEDLPNVAQEGGLSATQLRRIGIAVSAIDQTHSAEACWPMKGVRLLCSSLHLYWTESSRGAMQ